MTIICHKSVRNVGFFYESLTVIRRVPQKSVRNYEASAIERLDCIIISNITLNILRITFALGSIVIADFTGFFHFTHNIMITFVDCISFSWFSVNTLTCGLTRLLISSMPAFNNPGTTTRNNP